MNKRTIIKNGKVIFPDRIEENLTIVCEQGKISDILKPEDVTAVEGDVVIDARGNYISAGFIDITHARRSAVMISWMVR